MRHCFFFFFTVGSEGRGTSFLFGRSGVSMAYPLLLSNLTLERLVYFHLVHDCVSCLCFVENELERLDRNSND